MSTTTTGAFADQTAHQLLLRKFHENKRYKEEILKEITAAICAMLNSNGGKAVVNVDGDSNAISESKISQIIRTVEQYLEKIIGTKISSAINIKVEEETVTISVEKANSLITVDYHLYWPSQTQVIQVTPLETQETVKNEILNRNIVDEPVLLGSHVKKFINSKQSGLSETKTVQLKNLKAASSKSNTLADRMIGNKFDCYVSAFANYKGGHIYYGIDDDGIVAGEFIPNEGVKIIKKLEKTINKIIWPEPPKREVDWEIFFEPVLDENSTPIPSTFVIVIYIAPSPGGVFTKEPECYEMVEGKVVKMSFTTWKERILQPVELFSQSITQSNVKRTTWSSTRIQRLCSKADELLFAVMNKGQPITTISNNLVKKHPDVTELELLIVAKEVMANYRACSFEAARKVLNKYRASLRTVTELWMFHAIGVYLEGAECSVRGDVGAVNGILPEAVRQAESITPGRISAALYMLAAWNYMQQEGDDKDSTVLFATRALEDLKHVQDLPKARADMEQKAHIILAMFHLGCNRFAVPTKKDIDSRCLEKAKCSIMAVHGSIYDGNPICPYREAQFNMVQSILFYRQSQVLPNRKRFLEAAFDAAKKAESLASFGNFGEVRNWFKDCMTLFTEECVRTHVQVPC